MEILDITLKHFGRFDQEHMTFHPGVNVIYGGNETGKSTIHAFLRGMLYGIERGRGRAAKDDEYTLRQPWESDGLFSGSMRFESGGKIYRLNRNFSKEHRKLELFCETDGEELLPAQEALDGLLMGMNEAAFSNTLSIGGVSAQTGEALTSEIQNYMANTESGGAARINVKRAMEELQRERRRLETKKKQETAKRVEQVQELGRKMDYLSEEIRRLRSDEQECYSQVRALGEERSSQMGALAEDDRSGSSLLPWRIGKILMAVIAAVSLFAAIVMEQRNVRLGAAAVILLACLGVAFCGRREQELTYGKRQRQEPDRLHQALLANYEWICQEVREKEIVLQTLREQQERMQESGALPQELEEQIAAIYLAIDTLQEVTAQIYAEYGRKLNERVGEILSSITGGRYLGVTMDEELQIRLKMPDRVLRIEQVSRGTAEQVYFALRMAAGELLSGGEAMPMVLDDAFVTYDDARLTETLRWLVSCRRQVLLFTCQHREQEILKKI